VKDIVGVERQNSIERYGSAKHDSRTGTNLIETVDPCSAAVGLRKGNGKENVGLGLRLGLSEN
jgi:hypothetical protein